MEADYGSREWRLQRKAASIEWARSISGRMDVLLFDTETTGLPDNKYAEVVEISCINMRRIIIFDQLIKPKYPIPRDFFKGQKIYNHTVKNSPSFAEVYPQFLSSIEYADLLLSYNLEFDIGMIDQTARLHGLPLFSATCKSRKLKLACAMKAYAIWRNQWNPHYNSFRYAKLVGGNHRALGDCFATLAYLQQMANDGQQGDLFDSGREGG